MSRRAFSLVEVLVVMGLMGLIFGLTVYAIQNARFGKRLDEAAEIVASNLERARNYSLAAKIGSANAPTVYGVCLAQSSISFHEGSGCGDAAATSYALPNGITIANGTLQAGDDIAFRRLTGEATKYGTIVLLSPNGEERAVRVYSSGAIERGVAASVAFQGGGRLKITFRNDATNGAGAEVFRLPVLIKITSTTPGSSSLYTSVPSQSDTANKLRFVDANDYTYLPFEVESWNQAGTSYVWVLVPKIDNSTTDFIYAYYGTPQRNVPENNFRDTWADYTGVWHVNDAKDSSPIKLGDAEVSGGVSLGANSINVLSGGALYVPSGSNNYVSVYPEYPLGSYTIEAWLYSVASVPAGGYTIFRKQNESNALGDSLGIVATGYFGVVFRAWHPSGIEASGTQGVTGGAWHYAVSRHAFDGVNGVLELFHNAIKSNPTSTGGTGSLGNYPFRMGGNPYSPGFGGYLDELRISEVARTDAWIKASYKSILNPTAFTDITSSPF